MNHVKFLLLFFVILKINSLTCGGNCKAGNCPDCPCGVLSNLENSSWIALRCKYMFPSQQNCCQCIITSSSSGECAFTSYSDHTKTYQVGLFAMDQTLVKQRCQLQITDVCYHQGQTNIQCAAIIYRQDKGSWKSFPAAKHCGCLKATQTEQIQINPLEKQ